MTKTERQKAQAELWRNNGGKGGFKNPTGFGKTYQTLNFICKPMIETNRLNFFIVAVHTTALKKQWVDNIAKFLPGHEDRFMVDTIQGIVTRDLVLECSCLIIDELDEFFGPKRRQLWDNGLVSFKFLLWLSATPEDRTGRHKAFMEKFPMLDEVSVNEALMNGWITPFREFNVPVDLTPEEKQAYDDITLLLIKDFARFENNFDLVNKVLSKEAPDSKGKVWKGFDWACGISAKNGWQPIYSQYVSSGIYPKDYTHRDINTIEDIVAQWSPDKIMGYAKRVMQYIRERKMILYNSKAKREVAVALCKKFPDRKTILFSQSVAFADEVCQQLNFEGIRCIAYHSEIRSQPLRMDMHGNTGIFATGDWKRYSTGAKKGEPKIFSPKVIKEKTIEALSKGDCLHMSAGSGVDKGLDVPDIELGIVTSMTQNPSQYVQRRGRTTRVNPDGNPSFVYIVNRYGRGTKDEEYLRTIQKDKTFVFWIDDISQIGDGLVDTSDGFTIDDL